jgi:serine/threonine protein kinase
MQEPKIIVQSKQALLNQLPGVVVLPDAKKPIAMGSGIITSLISSGGMAIIYEIWNQELEVKRAIKLLHPDHSKESESRFQTEIKITAKLHHPNIVEIYAVGKWNDLPYIEMERIDGVTLEQLITDTGGLPVEVCASIGIMIGRALNYSHNQDYQIYGQKYHGIIHRDLKPGNVMVTNSGVVKLMDFGIAKPMSASTRTMEGVVMGTMQYLAPEQLDGKDIDERADIYSLGAVVYEMLTGARAFPEQNLAKLVTDKLNNNYVSLEGFSRKIPAALCGLVHKCLRYEKEKRVQNALEFLRTLGQIHKSLDEKSPEQLLAQFMKESHHGKTIVSLRKTARLFPAIQWLGVIVFLAAMVIIGLLGMARFSTELSQQPTPKNLDNTASPTLRPPDTIGHDALVIPEKENPPEKLSNAEMQTDKNATSASNADSTVPIPEIKNVRGNRSAKTEIKRKKSGRFGTGKPGNSDVFRPPAQSVPIAPATVPPATPYRTPGNTVPLIDKLKLRYNTSDIMTIFTGEVEAGHFQDALTISESLDKDYAASKKAKIFKLRALKGTGDKSALATMLLSNDLYDGEFYLEKGLYYLDNSDLTQCQAHLKKAAVSPCGFLESKMFRQNLLFSIARCASALYNQKPTNETKNKAMEAWYDVKSLFRTSPEHEYFKKADSEIRNISKSDDPPK